MYYCASGKIQYTPFVKESIRMPGPVGQWAIDENAKEYHKEQIGIELDTLGKTTCDKCRGDNGKFHLKYGKEHQWYGRSEGSIGTQAYISE